MLSSRPTLDTLVKKNSKILIWKKTNILAKKKNVTQELRPIGKG